MKYIPIYLSILVTFLTSCSEEVNLAGDFKETAVVYGLLDHADSLHFVKITRAFIGPGNALEIAQIPDSSYFDNVELTVSEYLGGALQRTWLLQDTIVTNKDVDGAFYAPEQKVYYFKTLPTVISSMGVPGTVQTSPNPLLTSLKPGCTYKMKAKINDGAFEVNGETELVNGLTTSASSQNFTFKFADDPAEYISTGVGVGSTGNAYIVNAQLDVFFNEHIGNNFTTKSFNWQLGENDVLPSTSTTFTALGKTFYELMERNVTDDPSIDKRTFNGISVTITGGAEELYNYMVVNKPTSSLAQSKPTYTNLSVTNDKRVVGIFSSRQTLKVFKPFFVSPALAYIRAIDKKSTRELCIGPITGPLLFCSDHPGDNIVNQQESFACN
ncbi:MAG: hypothetical protein ACOVQG_04065 [Crocinitomicaceae bacterium]